jgi:choline-sulfatase
MRRGKQAHSARRILRQTILPFSCAWMLFTLAACKASPPEQASASSATQPATANTAATQPVEEAPQKLLPLNVVLITLDTVRADHLHCYGNQKIQTPAIDDLAKHGVLFEKAVTQTPLTDPSHASIMTGLNPNVHHVRDTGGFALQPSSITLATILRDHGWNTGAFVSASVLKKSFGLNQGFSTYDDQMPRATGEVGYLRAASRPANITVDHAVKWVDTQSSKPFFLWVHLYDAHEPYTPPQEFRHQYPNDLYDAEIAFQDQQISRLLAAVKKKSTAGKTLIVLLADHGESLGDHGEFTHGIFLYDSTVRIPWIMTGPGVPTELRIHQQAREIDVLPTVLSLLGGHAGSAVQGTSVVPAFTGKPIPAIYSYEETLFPKINMGWSELRGIHTAHWMYVHAPKPELYDLDQDPGELNNIIDAHPKEYRELDQQLKILSNAGVKDAVVAHQMDQQTMEQLKSLGYVGGNSGENIDLNGHGADPKDRVDILKIEQVAMGPNSEKLPLARKIELLRQGLAEDPTNPALTFELSKLYMQSAQYDLALQVYLTALHQGVLSQMLLTRLGDLYLRAGQHDPAIHYFEKAVQLDPLDAESETNLGTAYAQSGRAADAEHAFRRALVAEQYPQAYNGLAILAMQRHDDTVAKKNYERAIQLNPEYPEAQFNLGLLCRQSNDLPCARKAFRSFLADAPPGSYKNAIPQAKAQLASMH